MHKLKNHHFRSPRSRSRSKSGGGGGDVKKEMNGVKEEAGKDGGGGGEDRDKDGGDDNRDSRSRFCDLKNP